MSTKSDTQVRQQEQDVPPEPRVAWYRSPWYNALILGLCNFLAPGIWGAMNSLGGGGDERPYLVNAANALTFGLMVVSCLFMSGPCVRYIGIKWTLILGTIGYAPYAAGLYTHNRYGDGWSWFVLFGAALCGISAGLFWMAEAAIALSYPDPEKQGRFLGLWLIFRVGGQILGGAVNLGVNVHRSEAGSVSYAVLIVFIALQALGPFAGLLVNPPEQVHRADGQRVHLQIPDRDHSHQGNRRKWYHCFWVDDLRAMTLLFFRRDFLAVIPLIAQAAYTEAVMFTYEDLWFSVRARALGSFISGILALAVGNVLGAYLDLQSVSLKRRSRTAFIVILTLQGAWWLWATVVTTEFRRTQPVYDWVDQGFGKGFALFMVWVAGFQLNYMFLYGPSFLPLSFITTALISAGSS